MSKYVIIGNSAAAVGCIEGIRKIDKTGEIVVISKESQHTYARPLISYLLEGKTDLERMKYRPDDFYEVNGVKTVFGKAATKIDADKKCVTLADGTVVEYEKLLYAAGSNPFVPHMQGMEKIEKQFTFMSLDDALAIEKELGKDKRVLIIGAGLIGMKCAEGICDRVKSITIVDMADRVLPAVLDAGGSEVIQKQMESKGIKFFLNDSAEQFEKNHAVLKSGNKVDFDICIFCVGVRPNTSMFAEAGGKVNRGIVTDDRQQTGIKDIYAAGDCAESYDVTTGTQRMLALLPNAYMQGEVAGINMAGSEIKFSKAAPMNAGGFFGLHIITAGSYDGCEVDCSQGDNYKKLFVKDGVLKGYIMIGDIRRAGIYTSLIREQTPLSSVNFELIKEHPQLMAFSKADRKAKLAAEV